MVTWTLYKKVAARRDTQSDWASYQVAVGMQGSTKRTRFYLAARKDTGRFAAGGEIERLEKMFPQLVGEIVVAIEKDIQA